ncbi:N-6 DNA methylase [Streptomyces sp. NPDC057101]|uniref:N-6 DNA methylase n=1 Tax=Streptomyces sp. NPDC057101 TaxID=3346020 RepID=UPI00364368BD
MNLFMYNLTDFKVEVGDPLRDPRFKKPDGSVKQFDVIVANPPYSLKWKPWTNDPRAIGGIAPQSSADWAFVQHMIASMDRIRAVPESSCRAAFSSELARRRLSADASWTTTSWRP